MRRVVSFVPQEMTVERKWATGISGGHMTQKEHAHVITMSSQCSVNVQYLMFSVFVNATFSIFAKQDHAVTP